MSKMTKRKGALPTKRTINLMGVGEKPLNLKVAIPAIILILLAAALISKFLVVDRLVALSRAESKLADTRAQVQEGRDRIKEFGEIDEVYSHYTYEGMYPEELTRPDRVAVMEMLRRVVLSQAALDSWTLSGEVLVITVTDDTFEDVNQIAQQLREEPIVEYCTVPSGTQYSDRDGRIIREDLGSFTGRITVYLKPQEVTGK